MTQLLFNGLVDGFLYTLVALGFSLIYRGTGVLHIAHGAIYTAAAYTMLACTLAFGTQQGSLSSVISVAVLLALLLSCSLGVLAEAAVYYPLFSRRASPLVAFISSLGVYIIIVNFIALFFGNEPRLLAPQAGLTFTVAGIVIKRFQVIELIISICLVLLVLYSLNRTALGRNIRALSDNPTLAGTLGVNVRVTRILVFTIGTLLCAASAIMRVYDTGINPHAGLAVALAAAVAVIIGGLNSPAGAILGALLLGVAQNFATYFFSAEWRDAVPLFLFIIFLLVRGEGIIGARLRMEEE